MNKDKKGFLFLTLFGQNTECLVTPQNAPYSHGWGKEGLVKRRWKRQEWQETKWDLSVCTYDRIVICTLSCQLVRSLTKSRISCLQRTHSLQHCIPKSGIRQAFHHHSEVGSRRWEARKMKCSDWSRKKLIINLVDSELNMRQMKVRVSKKELHERNSRVWDATSGLVSLFLGKRIISFFFHLPSLNQKSTGSLITCLHKFLR